MVRNYEVYKEKSWVEPLKCSSWSLKVTGSGQVVHIISQNLTLFTQQGVGTHLSSESGSGAPP